MSDDALKKAFDGGLEAVKQYVDSLRSKEARMPPEIVAAYKKVGPQKAREIEALVEAIVPEITDFVDKVVKPLREQIGELLAKVADLDARPVMTYLGTWSSEKAYGPGNFITDGGSVWHCQRSCVGERPGAGGDAWVLAVKKGRDMK